ncbi:helix-turn-helix domain-containing protein [[Kitasatospora] papulosa]
MESLQAPEALKRLHSQLQERRAVQGASVGNLARATGLSRTTISNALNEGNARPSRSTTGQLAKALRFTPDEITGLLALWEAADDKGLAPSAPVSAESAAPDDTREPATSPRRVPAFVAIGTATALFIAAGVVYGVVQVGKSDDASEDGKDEATRSSVVSGAKGPLLITHKWPTIKVCDGATSVAMSADGSAPSQFKINFAQQDYRPMLTTPESKGGAWGAGHLYLNLSAEGKETVTVDDIRLTRRFPKKISPPSWVVLTQGGCGSLKDRVFDLDLDRPELVDRGVQPTEATQEEPDPAVRANPLGSGFTVSATDPAIIRVAATACRGNYEWSVQIDYSYRGKSLQKEVGPFKSFSVRDENTKVYVPNNTTGKLEKPTMGTDTPGGCPATS